MNKYLSGFVALCVLPISAFAEEGVSTFDESVPASKKIVREYKTEKGPIVVYRQKDTPVSIVINKYNVDPSKEAGTEKPEEASNEEQSVVTANSDADKVQEVSKDIRNDRFYMGLNGDLSFLSWKNEYSSGTESGTDRFSFKPVLGADVVVGYKFNKNWRVDGEFGYIGKYSETETEQYFSPEKTEFNLQAYYADINAYCDIAYGFYAGLGGGLAIVNLSADNSTTHNVSATNLSPMGAIMFGWTYALDEKVDFDVRYRFAAFNGGNLNIGGVKVDTGLVMNNSLSVGVRYYF